MTRKPFIAGNWKMNKTVGETLEFINKLKKMAIPYDRDVLICPPFTALSEAFKASKDSKIIIGSQNMYYEDSGAFTGEISPLMLQEFGCKFTLIGHSERRMIFSENDLLLNMKLKTCLKHGITPIFCVGETIDERRNDETEHVIKTQILEGLFEIDSVENIIIAYEPVWAIGTGENATPEQAEEVHAFIRALIEGKYDKNAADKIRILYGGSVNPGNVKALMKKEDIDGVLVGGASLDIEKFYKLIRFDE